MQARLEINGESKEVQKENIANKLSNLKAVLMTLESKKITTTIVKAFKMCRNKFINFRKNIKEK